MKAPIYIYIYIYTYYIIQSALEAGGLPEDQVNQEFLKAEEIPKP